MRLIIICLTFDQAADVDYVAQEEATAALSFHEEYESEDGLDNPRNKQNAHEDDKPNVDIETTQTIDNNTTKDICSNDNEDSNETRGMHVIESICI